MISVLSRPDFQMWVRAIESAERHEDRTKLRNLSWEEAKIKFAWANSLIGHDISTLKMPGLKPSIFLERIVTSSDRTPRPVAEDSPYPLACSSEVYGSSSNNCTISGDESVKVLPPCESAGFGDEELSVSVLGAYSTEDPSYCDGDSSCEQTVDVAIESLVIGKGCITDRPSAEVVVENRVKDEVLCTEAIEYSSSKSQHRRSLSLTSFMQFVQGHSIHRNSCNDALKIPTPPFWKNKLRTKKHGSNSKGCS